MTCGAQVPLPGLATTLSPMASSWGILSPTPQLGVSLPDTGTWTCFVLSDADMVPLLLMPLLLGGEWMREMVMGRWGRGCS